MDQAMDQLPIFVNLVGQKVILLGDGPAANAKRRMIERAGAIVISDIDPAKAQGAKLAFIAIADLDAALRAREILHQRNLLVNLVDRPEYCDFTSAALIDRAPVQIAIGTSGRSAGLAKALKQRLDALLPASLGRLAEALYRARPMISERFPDDRARRIALDQALSEGGALNPLSDQHCANADRAIANWLKGSTENIEAGLYRLHLGDAPNDLTLGQLRLMANADKVWHDPGIAPAILAKLRADAEIMPGNPPEDIAKMDQIWLVLMRK